jgi:predicted DNA-binding transcriptional regulator AlpA
MSYFSIGNHDLPALLTGRDVARLAQLSESTIKNRRRRGLKPDYVRLGGAIRYPRQAVMDWISSKDGE